MRTTPREGVVCGLTSRAAFPDSPVSVSKRRRLEIASPTAVLTILALINFINYVDRQVIGPLVPLLKAAPDAGGLGLSDTQIGLLQTAFMLVHSVASIPLGIIADRFLRKRLIAIGVGLWSLATALAAAATGFTSMFLARATVGIGEATYAPAATALISEKFSPLARARALGVFQAGMVLGGAAAAVLGGQIGGHYGWRTAFLVVGLPGLVLTGLALLIREAPPTDRPHVEAGADNPHSALSWRSLKLEMMLLVRSPAALWINIAGTLITFFIGALIFWSSEFILRYHYNNDREALPHVATVFGAIAAASALGGALVGSYLADQAERRRPGAGRLLVITTGVLLATPFALVGFVTRDIMVLYWTIGVGMFFGSWYVGPILAALHDVVPAGKRGTVTGIYLLLIHLLGDAISPTIVGFIGTHTGSLRVGLAVAVALLAAGGLAALRAIPDSVRLAKLKLAASAR